MNSPIKIASLLLACFLASFVYLGLNEVSAQTVGRILLQVEEHGEAWYVVPEIEQRYYLRDGDAAYEALRLFGLGITNDDLSKIPVGVEDRFVEIAPCCKLGSGPVSGVFTI